MKSDSYEVFGKEGFCHVTVHMVPLQHLWPTEHSIFRVNMVTNLAHWADACREGCDFHETRKRQEVSHTAESLIKLFCEMWDCAFCETLACNTVAQRCSVNTEEASLPQYLQATASSQAVFLTHFERCRSLRTYGNMQAASDAEPISDHHDQIIAAHIIC